MFHPCSIRAAKPTGLCVFLVLFLNACGGGSNGPEPIDSTANTRDTTAVDSPADIFVATSGSDANSGTLAAPFKTISKASTVAVPGTTVHVAPGEYEGSFKTSASGTGAARIRYIADIPSSVKIVPPENSTDRSAWINEGDYVDIEGFEIDGTNFRGGLAWTSGIYLPGSFSAVKNNRIHDIATDPTLCTNDGGAAVVTDHYYFGTNNDVVGNVIHHIGSVGCDFIHGVYAGTSGMVANNLVYQIGYAAIHLWHDATSIVITNNTVFASTYGILVGGGDFYHSDAPADNIHVSNNIVMDNVFGIKETGFTGIHNTYVNNLLYMNSGLDWELQNDLVHSADVNLDPLFINYLRSGGGDYHLSPGSPAIDKGTSTMSPSTDLDGTRRPQGTSVDIGAYEFK